MKKMNEFLVTNFPRIWRSRIIFISICSFLTFIFFFLFIDQFDTELSEVEKPYMENDEEKFGLPALFLWTLFIFYWLYVQYQNKPFLKKFSFWEFLTGSILNTICLLIMLAPLFPLYTLTIDNPNDLKDMIDIISIIGYIIFLPVIFLPFIIRSYSLTEIIMIFMSVFLYGILVVLIFEGSNLGSDDMLYSVAIFHYLIILIYVFFKLIIRKYNNLDKWFIFFLVVAAPWFISFLIDLLIDGNHLTPDASFSGHEEMYFYSIIASYFFLLFLSWYITKSLQKPIILN